MIDQNKLNNLIKSCKYCSFCKACNNICPTWQVSGRDAEGPAGRLLLLQKWSQGNLTSREIAQNVLNCLQCGLCDKVCPARLSLTRLFAQASKVLAKFAKKKNLKERLFTYAIKNNLEQHPVFYDFCQPVIAITQRINGASPHRLKKVSNWANEFPAFGIKPFRLSQSIQNSQGGALHKPRILLFTGCVARRALPEIARDTAQILQDAGCEVISPAALTCCGNGRTKSGIFANANLRLLQKLKFDYLLAVCPSCLNAIKNTWPKLANSAESKEYAKSLSSKAVDLSSFIAEHFNLDYINFTPGSKRTSTLFWHNPCRETEEALQDINKLMDLWRINLTDLSGAPSQSPAISSDHICCGKLSLAVKRTGPEPSNAVFNAHLGESVNTAGCSENYEDLNRLIAKRTRNRIIGKIYENAAQDCALNPDSASSPKETSNIIITSCPRCVYTLRAALNWQGDEVEVNHISKLYLEKLKASIPYVKPGKLN